MDTVNAGTITLMSVHTSATGEYADNMEYPYQVQVEMPLAAWQPVQAMLAALPPSVMSVDIDGNGWRAAETFMDGDWDSVGLESYEDLPEVACYRFIRRSPTYFSRHLVLRAKHHPTEVGYELVTPDEARAAAEANDKARAAWALAVAHQPASAAGLLEKGANAALGGM